MCSGLVPYPVRKVDVEKEARELQRKVQELLEKARRMKEDLSTKVASLPAPLLPPRKSTRGLNWDRDVLPYVREAIKHFGSMGVVPTLRTIFYYLVSKNVIPNTKNSYKHLSRKMVTWRKKGIFAWDVLIDKVRIVYGKHEVNHNLEEWRLEEYRSELEEALENLDIDKLIDMYLPSEPWFYVDKWAEQNVIVEVWIEKEALGETIKNWCNGLGVVIRVNRGYSSWTFIYNNVQQLRNVLQKVEKVIVLYLGDLDPSGVDIERFLRKALRYFGLDESKVQIIRLAVTLDQVKMYNLPPAPESMETIEKLARDPRARKYFGIDGPVTADVIQRLLEQGKAVVVELDALVAFAPNEFKKLLRETILSYWDESKYNELLQKKREFEEKAKKLRKEYKKRLKERLRQILS